MIEAIEGRSKGEIWHGVLWKCDLLTVWQCVCVVARRPEISASVNDVQHEEVVIDVVCVAVVCYAQYPCRFATTTICFGLVYVVFS